jgi:hypothetical protein
VAEADELILLREVPVDLARDLVEEAEVGGDVLALTRDRLVDLEVVVGAVEPELVLHHRPAQVDVKLAEQADGRRGSAPVDESLIDVVLDHASGLEIEVGEARELVPPALERGHDTGPGARHLHVRALGADAELLDGVVIVVASRPACPLGGVDTFVDDSILVAHAEAVVIRLLALVGAPDVEARHADTRGLLQDRPHVGRTRNVFQLLRAERGPNAGGLDIDNGRSTRDGDGLGHSGNRQGGVDGKRIAYRDEGPVPVEGLEARELEEKVIAPWGQGEKSVAPVDARGRDPLAHHRRSRQRDGYAR